jgi:hypothetical protein
MADVQTGEAAKRLGTTTQNVGNLIAKNMLKAKKLKRGKRFLWLVDEASLERLLREHGRFDKRRRSESPASRLKRVEAELASLRRAFDEAGLDVSGASDAVARERDDLRAEVSTLREALARSREAAELQRDADAERASIIEHLAAAAAASERADTLRRRAFHELEDALAGALGPGHAGDLTRSRKS